MTSHARRATRLDVMKAKGQSLSMRKADLSMTINRFVHRWRGVECRAKVARMRAKGRWIACSRVVFRRDHTARRCSYPCWIVEERFTCRVVTSRLSCP